MYYKCCVVNCDSRRKDVNFYRFPSFETGLQKWLECINSEHLRSLSKQNLLKQFVCQKHFEERFLAATKIRSRLRVGAYPTLFKPEEISSGSPNVGHDVPKPRYEDHDYYNKKRPHVDHSYSKVVIAEKRSKLEIDNVEAACASASNILQVENEKLNDGNIKGACSAITFKPFDLITHHSKKRTTSGSKIAPILCPSTPTSRRRIIARKHNLTPNCARLYHEFAKSRKQLRFSVRARRALKFSKEMSFEKLTAKMNPLAKKMMWMQIKQCPKKIKGRRFTDEEKLISLAIMKQSPKCYKFLHKIFILPSKHTLNKMIAKLNIESGVNSHIMEAVKKEVDSWQDNKKYCSVLFDEVALETELNYDKHKDVIDGFVELNERTNDFADHALVFMLRGAVYKWQQPLVFYFCKGATSSQTLKIIIKNVICAVGQSGLLPIALVCDQGSAFQSAVKSLKEDTRRDQIKGGKPLDDVIVVNNHTLSVFYDPPHLIKGIRNNFLTKNIKFEGKIAKWEDIMDVYKTDCNHAEMRLLYKLNDEHVIPDKIKKMKVKNCVRALSKTVAATLCYTAQFSHYTNGERVSKTLQNTAEIVSFFDDLFDSVNGASLGGKKNRGKPLRHAVTEKSIHHEFWNTAIKKLKGIRFVDKFGKELTVPTVKNWVTTLESFQRVNIFFKTKGIKIMRPRYFNSDPIENFFGQVRAYNFRNNNPSTHTFKNTFRSLLITRFIKFHSDSYNCEEDSGDQLLKWKTLFEAQKDDVNLYKSLESSNFPSSNIHSTPSQSQTKSAKQERLAVHSRIHSRMGPQKNNAENKVQKLQTYCI